MAGRVERSMAAVFWVCLALSQLNCASCGRRAAMDTLDPEGAACALDADCETGLCDVVPGTNERVCLRKCTSGCKDLDQCTSLAADRFGCVPQRSGLCQTCVSDSDCPYPADKCITLGTDKFCGRDCSFDEKCPATFRCADGIDVNGNQARKQCQPSSGTCACIASTSGQMMPCEVTNSFGTCLGNITCQPPTGWSACTARTPVAELCNGRDDDCDGMTDEELPDLTCGAGACERTAAACVNGRPGVCTPGVAEVEICNRIDDNCNGAVDENFNLQTDVGNCGACNRTCAFTNAVPGCVAGACAIDRCLAGWVNLDGVMANGCEHPCTPSNGGVEVCDGLDNNCDGRTDEGFDLVNDPTNCGQCGLVCNVANGSVSSYRCVATRCAVGMCAMGRGDCNQAFADGCEENLVTSLSHCGQCGNSCMPANATGTCQMGACRIQMCNAGFRDCNGLVSDGCEVNTGSDLMNCGQCGRVCSAANANSTCTSGTCGFTCLPNWFDADNNASNGCEYACVRTNNGVEACDGIDNDCDNRVDEDFDLMTSSLHCGMCNRACTPPSFAMSTACGSGVCAITACVSGRANCNNAYADGCEISTTTDVSHCSACNAACNAPNVQTYQCQNSQCGIVACVAGRGNCNNQFTDGCEVNTTNSLAHCGGCNQPCTVANGVAACVAGMCGIGNCLAPFADCNGTTSDGCEVNTSNNAAHCGGCNQACTRPFSTGTCSNSMCSFVCEPGRVDLDGLASNGCEYACTATGSDMPDLSFIDADCDGFDGTASQGVFVAKTGNDANLGTRASPRLTITGGIARAVALGLRAVFISEGQYDESVTMGQGVSLYGGYSAANSWTRGTTHVVTISSATQVGVSAFSLTGLHEIQLLTVRTGNAVGVEPNGDGKSTAAVHVVNMGGGFVVNGCTLLPGAGSAGAAGVDGSMGLPGSPGGPGTSGNSDPAVGGPGGASACGATGGMGGTGVNGEVDGNAGSVGATGPSGAAGTAGGLGGPKGDCDTFDSDDGDDAPAVSTTGTVGGGGLNGNPGPAAGTLTALGSFLPSAGLAGATGQSGGGGGGGGSGGGTSRGTGSSLCASCSGLRSGGGGGGGGGGCGGTAGSGGRGGGGSFGVASINSVVSVLNSNVTTSAGGNGGTGGSGGPGGSGGDPGAGSAGQAYTGSSCDWVRAGNGVIGAAGGAGGRGGGGSGGPGGPSICVFYKGAVPTVSALGCSNPSIASGGAGGTNGTVAAASGPAGIATNLLASP